ncbi:hypothetical protein TEA_001816 [Camellia sinensis var. sinensis]|uniref:Uncharacterized protein n=1 Tax=Camellia sinensis var. sinensis TaxID=542762 RepID=A0A4S4ESZ0_CAMSN|nr:hypothetical protein TEA_001816 [Camellia sinensis var. sinensis]
MVRSSYLFLNPLQLLAKDGLCLRYAANFAKQGAFKAMGPFATEMCASYCLSLVVTPISDIEAKWTYILLKEFSKCLKQKAVKALILHAIQTILQASCVWIFAFEGSILQDSFVHEIWHWIGLCSDGIDVLVRIDILNLWSHLTGGLLGVNFVVRQILPLQRNVVNSCVDASYMTKPEPMQIWSSLALNDIGWSPCSLTDGAKMLEIPNELPNILSNTHMDVGPTPHGTHTHDGSCLHVMVLMQTSLDTAVLQVAATSLIAICERIGPDLTALHVLPKLKELFDELAFSQETSITSGSLERSFKVTKRKVDEEDPIESHMDLVVVPHGCFLSNSFYGAITGSGNIQGSPLEVVQTIVSKGPVFSKSSTSSEYNPAKLLLNGVGWSILQSQGNRSAKNLMPHKRASDLNQDPVDRHVFGKHEPWHWFPSPGASWDGPDFLGRVGSLRDGLPWKIRASELVQEFKGIVQKWDLSRINCTSGYYGHEEVLNDICVLSSHERVASCDGTVHVWNSQTAYSAHVWKLISIFAESSANSAHVASPSTSTSKINTNQPNMLNSN